MREAHFINRGIAFADFIPEGDFTNSAGIHFIGKKKPPVNHKNSQAVLFLPYSGIALFLLSRTELSSWSWEA